VVIVLNVLDKDEASGGEDRIGAILMELQGTYMVGAAEFQGQGGLLLAQAEGMLNEGSIDQRQRMVILAGELGGDEDAHRLLSELSDLVLLHTDEAAAQTKPEVITADQQRVQEILLRIYAPAVSLADMKVENSLRIERIDALPQTDRDFLVKRLGWFGKLALAPAGEVTAQAMRDEVIGSARRVFAILIGIVAVIGLGGLLGFGGLVVLFVLALTGRVRSGLGPPANYHGIYAETFAVWMVLFLGLQKPLQFLGPGFRPYAMVLVLAAFFASLLALFWPVMRGVKWSQVRRDIGWTLGRQPALEPLIGLGGYFMALPMLAVGVGFTLLLMLVEKFLQQSISGDPGPFDPAGGAAHPIIEQLGGANWWPKIQILLLAAVAAPIIEETMFRGVLYRHLRDASGAMGVVLSVIVSATINALLFAAIHPQGWVAIPALMSLAYAFIMMREWRGTIIPSMIMHGVSNGIVIGMLIVLLGV
jgi:membrane protease YdiL (CAAX protease family)